METATADHVYVVSLGPDTPSWSTISWRDIVNVRQRYFHPIGRRYPNEPVRALGFRYDSRLQSVHHVDEVVTIACRSELSRYFPEIDGDACRRAYDDGKHVPHFVYTLSAPTHPNHVVHSGKVRRSARVWADRDLLLSSESISGAVELSKQRATERFSDIGDGEIIPLPIDGAQRLIARIRLLRGLPERNHEDAVKDLLIRLGYDIGEIVFQRGRIDISIVNQNKEVVAVIEVKRTIISESERMRALRQGMNYAKQTGAVIVIVTDGDRFEIYDRRKLNHDEMLCGRFQLSMFRKKHCAILDFLRPSSLRNAHR